MPSSETVMMNPMMVPPMMVPPMMVPHMMMPCTMEPLHVTTIEIPSSAGSNQPNLYPVDAITVDTPCSLHIPMGRSGKTKEVAQGLALVSTGSSEGQRILDLYAWVQVLTINPKYDEHFLDFPPDEEIETLGQAVGNKVLWHKRDITF